MYDEKALSPICLARAKALSAEINALLDCNLVGAGDVLGAVHK